MHTERVTTGTAIQVLDWKISFIEQYHEGLDIWDKDYTRLRIPMIYNLRADPFERGPKLFLYADWKAHHVSLVVPGRNKHGPGEAEAEHGVVSENRFSMGTAFGLTKKDGYGRVVEPGIVW